MGYIPATLPSGDRRSFPWKDNSRTLRVPLWPTSPQGQEVLGLIKVPLRLCWTPQHSNERLEFEKFLAEQVHRWIEWRGKRGWFIASRPKVTGPFDPQTDGDSQSQAHMARATEVLGKSSSVNPLPSQEEGDVKWFWVTARFSRTNPLYARLDDILFLKDLAKQNQVDPSADAHPWNDPSTETVTVDGGVDIMQAAEARRQKAGKKRADYLFGPLEEPL